MKLFEISVDVSATRFKSVIRDLIANVHKTNAIVQDMIERGTGDSAKRTANSMNARWFTTNYPTLQSSAQTLKSVNKNFDVIAKIPVNAYLGGGESGTSKGQGYRVAVAALQGALKAIDGADLFAKYQEAYAKQERLLASAAPKEDPVAAPKAPAAADPRKAALGAQISQIEAIINATIKDLPAALQHEARTAVNRSDNKLAALQQFMTAKGI